MTPEEWGPIKDLFDSGCELSAGERAGWLDRQQISAVQRAELERLFRLHEEAGSGFLKRPPDAVAALRLPEVPKLADGRTLAGRYRIVRFLGRGGMGEVYEAEDAETREHVAVKVLRDDLAANDIAVRRFEREVRLAREIVHRNVCRVLDMGRDGDCLFISMELLRGDTLSELLKTKIRFDPAEAEPLVRQILGGLGAAHAAGIVHRDLKPSNIMVVRQADGTVRVAITDFGLALRPEGADSSLTKSGGMVGTLEYMAPEQLRGDPISKRTDIYSLGLVLYEMLTGEKPFPSGPETGPVGKRLDRGAPRLSREGRRIDSTWENTILSCLTPRPESRPSSVEVVGRLLGSAPRAMIARMRTGVTRRRVWTSIGAATVSVSLFAYIKRLQERGARAHGVSALLLTDIVNVTGEKQFDGTTALMRLELGQSAQFEVVSDERVRGLLLQMQRAPGSRLDAVTAREVALRGAAQVTASGELRRDGAGYELRVRIEQVGASPRDVAHAWDQTFRAAAARELMGQIRDASTWIRERAGEADAEIARLNQPPEDLTTGSWEALRTYALARRRRSEGHREEAATLFREAISADGDFAAAHEQLADLLISERRYAEGYRAWQLAIAIARKRNLTHRERYRGEGSFYNDAYDWEAAATAYRNWVAHYPNDAQARYQLASMLSGTAQYEESIEQFQASQRLNAFYGCGHRLMRLYLLRGDGDAAMREMAALQRSAPKSCYAFNEAYLAFLGGRSDEALSDLRRLGAMAPDEWSGSGPYVECCVLAERGDAEQAATLLETRIQQGLAGVSRPSAAEHRNGLAALRLRTGDGRECRRWSLEAAARDPGPKVIAVAATLLARAGFADDAARTLNVLDDAPALPVYQIARSRALGEIALARGQTAAGVGHLETAARLTPGSRHTDYLAEAYARTGATRKAADLYERWLQSPAWLWRAPDSELPGFLSAMIQRSAALGGARIPSLAQTLRSIPFLAPTGTAGPR